jgi:hypothetical protein
MKLQFVQIAMMLLFGFLLVYIVQALGQKVLARVMRSVVIFLAAMQAVQMIDGFFAALNDSRLGQFLAWLERTIGTGR